MRLYGCLQKRLSGLNDRADAPVWLFDRTPDAAHAPQLEEDNLNGVGGASRGGIGDLIFPGFGGSDGAAIWVGHFER